MERPIRVGITHGDVNGVGYEVIFKAIAEEGMTELFTPVVFGLQPLANKALQLAGAHNVKLNVVNSAEKIKDGKINLWELKLQPELHPGEVRKDAGQSAVEALETAVEAFNKGDIDVIVTAPISKEAVQSDTFKFPGHTEFLTERVGEGEEAMMILCDEALRVALQTVHLPITQVAENISQEKIIENVEKLSHTLKKDFGVVRPAIAVLSLNPHSGDGGLLGKEEEDVIQPALQTLVEKGYLAYGPFPADGFFGHQLYKKFDGVLAMYHDQGLAPFKTIAKDGGVNFSASLPLVRTSPDHGTAFDIAWKGVADPASMRNAIYMAIDIFRRREDFEEAAANPLKKFVHEKPEKGEKNEKQKNKVEADD